MKLYQFLALGLFGPLTLSKPLNQFGITVAIDETEKPVNDLHTYKLSSHHQAVLNPLSPFSHTLPFFGFGLEKILLIFYHDSLPGKS